MSFSLSTSPVYSLHTETHQRIQHFIIIYNTSDQNQTNTIRSGTSSTWKLVKSSGSHRIALNLEKGGYKVLSFITALYTKYCDGLDDYSFLHTIWEEIQHWISTSNLKFFSLEEQHKILSSLTGYLDE
ncbi:unnamed protein product [Sphenostylis stenocarpa]|uniref:Uncharacterized protein n=1 Tax=Sphenostylis stenocarpa TaxID=92480 RepID=A0AA86SUG2_9FABA|nr:unnamed protein product [Sphenostylis stenocarpa]